MSGRRPGSHPQSYLHDAHIGAAMLGARCFWVLAVTDESRHAAPEMPPARGYRIVRHGWADTVPAGVDAAARAARGAGIAVFAGASRADHSQAALARMLKRALDDRKPKPQQPKPQPPKPAKSKPDHALPPSRWPDKEQADGKNSRAAKARQRAKPTPSKRVRRPPSVGRSRPRPRQQPAASSLLGLGPTFTSADVHAAFRRLALAAHPDHGGSSAAMRELIAARDAALRLAVDGGA